MSLLWGGLAGIAIGYVLQRGQLCFHSMFAGAYEGRWLLLRGWILAVAIASVGLAVLYASPLGDGLNTGLGFTPVSNVVGGLLIGVGMVVASSCVSGLFYKLGSGMLGALVGLVGWSAGELAGNRVSLPGPSLLGEQPTIPQVLGVPRLLFALVFLAVVVTVLVLRPNQETPEHAWQWGWRPIGIALGLATILSWVLAKAGGSGFGASTVGASVSVAAGTPNVWLVAFLVGITVGGFVAARTAGGLWVRGEAQPVRYLQLAAGGFLLGAGGIIGGGCNLGHGLSGVAQMNVSSWVVVAAIVAGVGGARAVRNRVSSSGPLSRVG